MAIAPHTVLVLGATGQQGGSVTRALQARKWPVRALVRDPATVRARTLAEQGVEVVKGDLANADSLRAAMAGVRGVFSVQPSSGQGAVYNVSDDDEVRYGKCVADVAVECGVPHLVYSSANAAGDTRTGMGHFDSKSDIERYIRSLPIKSTIVRPSAFMEILMLPGMGLERGELSFFMRPDQPMQFLAVDDIGKIVAHLLAHPGDEPSRTLEIAGDTITGRELETKLTQVAGRPIAYRRFDEAVLSANPFLRDLAALVDEGRLAGHADIAALRRAVPGLLTFDDWLAGPGKPALDAALRADAGGVSLR